MAEVDLAAAVDAAAIALWAKTFEDELAPPEWASSDKEDRDRCNDVAKSVVDAAAPLIEQALRDRIAEDIKAFAKEAAKTDTADAIVGLITAAAIAKGERYPSLDALADEVDAALDGASVSHHTD